MAMTTRSWTWRGVLFVPDRERLAFLDAVFSKRLKLDQRVPEMATSLRALLGRTGLSKTEFARRLRVSLQDQISSEQPLVPAVSQRRGRSRGRVHYFGEEVVRGSLVGDTRTMIQLITDALDQATDASPGTPPSAITVPVDPSVQDRLSETAVVNG